MSLENKTLLIVEDQQSTRELLSEYMEMSFGTILEAEHGKEAITLFEEHSVDIVFSDLDMPEMDGIELTRWIRSNRGALPIIVMSGYESDQSDAMEAGANLHILKPVHELEAVVDRLEQLLA
jgi:CheY-like chemotaxis protein